MLEKLEYFFFISLSFTLA